MITILPAIDIIQGKCVRLVKGKFDSKKIYGDPVETAMKFEQAGARYLHLVDLDGARNGSVINYDSISGILQSTALSIEFGGGIDSVETAEKLVSLGVEKLVIGTKSITDPGLLDKISEAVGKNKIVIAADILEGKIAINAWQNNSRLDINIFINEYKNRGYREFLCTDIKTDGMLSGPSINLYKQLMDDFKNIEIIASGGISSENDMEMLRNIGLKKVIVGKAFYEKKIGLEILRQGGNYAG